MTTPPRGHVDLVCFEVLLGDSANLKGAARHYLGWADDIEARMASTEPGGGRRNRQELWIGLLA